MTIAYTMAAGRGDTDLLLFHVAQTLQERRFQVSGIVQINSETDCPGPCDMDVRVLPKGPVIRISQRLGKEATGCRLDPGALETAVGFVESGLANGADCLVINKFGKHEAEGRGFRGVIAEALAMDIPIIVGVNPLNLAAFLDFAGGLAVRLEPDIAQIVGWVVSAHARGASAKPDMSPATA